MKPITFYIKRGDRLKSLRVTMLDGATPIDLTTATGVIFKMQRRDRSGNIFTDNAVIVDAINGVVEYQWAAGTTDSSGLYDVEFETTFSGGKTETFPKTGYIQLEIDGDLQAPITSNPLGVSPYVTRLFGNRASISPTGGTGDVTVLSGRVDATVSAFGIANGRSSFINDGADFGPDTVGTTTCGIQEAIHSLMQSTVLDGTVGGGRVRLGPGRFITSTTISIPNQFNFEVQLQGSGKIVTQILYTGTSDIVVLENTTGGTPLLGGTKPGQYSIRDIGFIYQQDTSLSSILHLANKANQGVIDNCSFTVKQCLDFVGTGSGNVQGQGGGLLFIGGTPQNAVGVIGIRIEGGFDNKVIIRKCDFYGLAVGIMYGCDHGTFEDLMMVSCGKWFTDLGGGTYTSHFGTAYTAINTPGSLSQYVNNCLAVGGCIFLNNNIYEININRCYFMESQCGVLNVDVVGFGPNIKMFNCYGETLRYLMLAGLDNNNESFAIASILSQLNRGSGDVGYIDLTNGAILALGARTPDTFPTVIETTIGLNGLIVSDLYSQFNYLSATPFGIQPRAVTKALRNTLSTIYGTIIPTGTVIYQTDNVPGLRTYNGTHWVRYTETNDD